MATKRSAWSNTNSEFLTVPQVGRLLGIPYNTVLKMVKTGVIPGAFRIGRRTLYKRASIEAWRTSA